MGVSARIPDKKLFRVKRRGGYGFGPTVGEGRDREGKQLGLLLSSSPLSALWHSGKQRGQMGPFRRLPSPSLQEVFDCSSFSLPLNL